MKRDHNAAVWLIFYIPGGLIWAVLMLVKATGQAYLMGWPLLSLGIIWIPVLVTALAILIAWISLRYREWSRRREIARTLWEAMHGLTLNSVGPIYGVQRKPGEKNQECERRILRAARTVDKINLTAPLEAKKKPATGIELDAIAHRHGLSRKPKETDAALQARIRKAVIEKLERRKGHGL